MSAVKLEGGLSLFSACRRCVLFQRGLACDTDTPSAKLRRAFGTLGLVQDECTVQDIRNAYLDLAKRCHPDSRTMEASTEQFILVREAYKVCSSYAKNVTLTREIHDAMEEELQNMEKMMGFRHPKKVAHRQYLQYDGVGPGTPSQRQRAHMQIRLDQGRESVFEKKFQDALIDKDTKEVGLYSPWPKSTQTTNSLERIANEMIRESIKRGEFSNLPGRGRPMEDTWDNPVLSTMEQKISVMMSNSGFAPDWVMLDKDIRTKVVELKGEILVAWNKCGPHPMSHSKRTEWEQDLLDFQEKVKYINQKIRHRNLIGPLVGQKVHIRLQNLVSLLIADVIPVSDSETQERAITKSTGEDTDSHNVVGVAGFILAIFGFWGVYR